MEARFKAMKLQFEAIIDNALIEAKSQMNLMFEKVVKATTVAVTENQLTKRAN